MSARATSPDSHQKTSQCNLAKGPTRSVARVVDGETLQLDDGTEVRLINALTPRHPLPHLQARSGFQHQPARPARNRLFLQEIAGHTDTIDTSRQWPPAEAAKQLLEDLVLGQSVTLWSAVGYKRSRSVALNRFRRDRYGRVLAHVTRSDPETGGTVWLQAALLRAGLARAYSTRDARSCIQRLHRHETHARRANRGLWTHATFAIRAAAEPDALLSYVHTFQLVEGRVLRVQRYRNRTYLNFGKHWKTDFTLVVDGRAHRLFGDARKTLVQLQGRRVRVRGWIEQLDGPIIRLSHPEQIEDLGPALPDWAGDGDSRNDNLAGFDAWRRRAGHKALTVEDMAGDFALTPDRERVPEYERRKTNRALITGSRRKAKRTRKQKPAPAAKEANRAPVSEFLSM